MSRTREQLRKQLPRYEELASLAQALASPIRLEIIECLAQRERSVESLAGICALSVKTMSHHLQKLLAADLVVRKARGREAIYSLRDEQVVALWAHLASIAGRRRTEPGDATELPSVDTRELQSLLAAGDAVLLDVRPRDEHDAGHIPHARPGHLDELPDLLAELPRDQTIIAFCRGPYCGLADAAVALLRRHGLQAYRYPGGVMEWRAAGQTLAVAGDDAP